MLGSASLCIVNYVNGNFLSLMPLGPIIFFFIVLVLPFDSRLNFALNQCGSTTFIVFLVLQTLWYLLLILLSLTGAEYFDYGTIMGVFIARVIIGLTANILSILYWSRFKSLALKNKLLAVEQGNVLLE